MVHAKKLNYTIANLILASLLSLSFIYALTSSLAFNYTPVKILGISFVLLTLYSMLFWNKITRRLTLGVSIFAIGLFVFNMLSKGLTARYLLIIIGPVYWLMDYISGLAEFSPKYEAIITILICIIVTLSVYLLTLKFFSFPVIMIAGTTVFAAQWILEFFVSYGAFYLYVFTILVFYFRHIYYKKYVQESGDYVNPAQFIIWILPLCSVIFLSVFYIPTSQKPIEWKWLDKKIVSLSEFFNTTYSNSFSKFDYFSIEYTGFGNNDKLGGKVNLDKTVVLEVDADRTGYLRASGKDTYTGNAWIDTSKDMYSVNSIDNRLVFDFLEVGVGLPFLMGSRNEIPEEEFMMNSVHSITFKGLKTKSLFLPYMTQKINFTDGQDHSTNINSNTTIVMDKTAGKDFSYNTDSIYIDYSNENLINLLRKSRKGLYSDIITNKISSDSYRYYLRANPVIIRDDKGNRIRYNEFTARLVQNSDLIYSKYTAIPEITPQRVKDLAIEVTSGQKNNYDKVKAIEQYLSKNFPYTLSPKATPKGRDFVDYFLFDIKQGYCTYYASAMAIMVRSIGLPSRYVEGYMMPLIPDLNDTYVITNENAHAWVEVYFEGFGWVPFEPTAAFTTGFYLRNRISQEGYDGIPEEVQEEAEQTPEPTMTVPGNIPELNNTDDEEEKFSKALMTLIAAGSVVLIFLSVICINTLKNKKNIKKLMKMNTRDSVLAFYSLFIYMLKLQGYAMKLGETPMQYAQRLDSFMYFGNTRFAAVSKDFVEARYSRNDLDDSVKDLFFSFYKELELVCKKDIGKYKFFLYRYILGIL